MLCPPARSVLNFPPLAHPRMPGHGLPVDPSLRAYLKGLACSTDMGILGLNTGSSGSWERPSSLSLERGSQQDCTRGFVLLCCKQRCCPGGGTLPGNSSAKQFPAAHVFTQGPVRHVFIPWEKRQEEPCAQHGPSAACPPYELLSRSPAPLLHDRPSRLWGCCRSPLVRGHPPVWSQGFQTAWHRGAAGSQSFAPPRSPEQQPLQLWEAISPSRFLSWSPCPTRPSQAPSPLPCPGCTCPAARPTGNRVGPGGPSCKVLFVACR